MPAQPDRLFLPGFGARARLYARGLPAGWLALEPPSFARSDGSFLSYRRWIIGEVDRRTSPVELAGHSMGAALAISAAAARPDRVRRLVLLSPAGLPLLKPIRASLHDLATQTAHGLYPPAEIACSLTAAIRAPRRALRLAREVHQLDLSEEMEAVRRAGIQTTVVGCLTDTLVTPHHYGRAARLLGATRRDLSLAGGHMWMLRDSRSLARELGPSGA
jgi:pimeloyl-ACP methyl ester carboxylesterase